MKRFTKTLMLALALAVIAAAFTGCAKMLSGEYSKSAGVSVGEMAIVGGDVSFKFSGSKVTITTTVTGIITGSKESSFDGTYEIKTSEDDKMTITMTFGNEEVKTYSGTFSFAEGTENGKSFIKIAGVKYGKK